MCPIRPSIVPTSLPVVSIMYMICSQCLLHVSLLWLGRGQLCFGCYAVLRSGCVRHPVHALYSAWYNSTHESTGCIYNVYDMLTMLAACIAALVGTWSVVFPVLMQCCAVGVSVIYYRLLYFVAGVETLRLLYFNLR